MICVWVLVDGSVWTTGKWERVDNSSLPRHQRLCERCAAGQVEDEFHVVFEYDAYLAVRGNSWKLFVDLGTGTAPAML